MKKLFSFLSIIILAGSLTACFSGSNSYTSSYTSNNKSGGGGSTMSDADAVAAAIAELSDADFIFTPPDTSVASVTGNITLPLTGSNHTTIAWHVKSGSDVVINGNTAEVTRPSATSATDVITATVSKGSASDTKDFSLYIVFIGNGLSTVRSYYGNNLAVSPNNVPYVLIAGNTITKAQKWNGTMFVDLPTTGMPTACNYGAGIAADSTENVYIVTTAGGNANVFKLTNGGTAWVQLGSADFSTGGNISTGNSPKILIGTDDKPVVMVCGSSIIQKLFKYDGSDWVDLGLPAGLNFTYKADFAIFGTTIYFATTSQSSTCAMVYSFDGSSWTRLGTDSDLTAPDTNKYPTISAVNNGVSIAYQDVTATANTPKINIAQWDGSVWNTIDETGFVSFYINQGVVGYMRITAVGNDLYFACDGYLQAYFANNHGGLNTAGWHSQFYALTGSSISYRGLYSAFSGNIDGNSKFKLYLYVGSPSTGNPHVDSVDVTMSVP